MIDALGVITNKPDHYMLEELTKHRNINTLPIGGKYMLIDFPLSNMVNMGLKKIGVFGNHNYKSLIEHLGTGQEWSLNRKSKGLSILNSANFLYVDDHPIFNLMDFQANLKFFQKTSRNHFLIASGNVISKIDYNKALKYHKLNHGEITLIYSSKSEQYDSRDDYMLQLDYDGKKVLQILDKKQGKEQGVFLDMLIINRNILLKLLDECDRYNCYWDLMKVIRYNLDRFQVLGFKYDGYYCKINSVEKYFKCSMDLLNPKIKEELFNEENKIYTNIKDNHPTRYYAAAKVNNSLVASGCRIEGIVDSSIVFRQVTIKPSAHIEKSIIMDNCVIGKNVVLENVILDKGVIINDDIVLKGKEDAPIVIGDGRIIG